MLLCGVFLFEIHGILKRKMPCLRTYAFLLCAISVVKSAKRFEQGNSMPFKTSGGDKRGRLLRYARYFAGALACVFVLMFCGAGPVRAAGVTKSQALASCQGWLSANNAGGVFECIEAKDGTYDAWAVVRKSDGAVTGLYFDWQTDDTPPSNTCATSAASAGLVGAGQFGGKFYGTSTRCQGIPQSDGSTIYCVMQMQANGPATQNQWGSWNTMATLSATGGTCDGVTTWKQGTDQSGQDLQPQPAAPTPQAVQQAATPAKTCGGGSCYDPSQDQFCAVSDGQQVCVSGASARSAGGCSSGGDAAVCAGAHPPLPSAPPASPISDPATQVKASDQYAQADPTSGAVQSITVNTYSVDASAPASGKGQGDTGPAPASSSPSSGGSASGGGDCGSPPVCSGDAPTCMVAQQVWETRCGPSKGDKNADGQPDWTVVRDGDVDTSGYATTPTDPSAVISTQTDSTSSIQESGWVGSACPQLPSFQVFGRTYTFDQDTFCNYLSLIRGIVIFFASFASVLILASGGKR